MIRTPLLHAVLVALISSTPALALAQVGHPPERSPYRDFEVGQSLTVSGGWLATKRDPANVAPKESFFGAVRYDVPVGGPASLYVRYMFSPSERRLLAPANPAATRVLRMESVSTSVADLGLELSLTGRKSWRSLSPTASAGVGLATDFAKADTGAYRFGTRFAFTYGLGLRYIPSSRYTFRADLINYTWQYQYPDRYFIRASDSTSVLTDTRQRSAYRGNWALSAGVTIPIFR
ncbi:MAG: hypothetical protein V4617_15445 [Gemmatimonadota bacterium]